MGSLQQYITEQNSRMSGDSVKTRANPSDYQINISHPLIIPYYERFKEWKVLGRWPISDELRLEFEAYIFKEIEKGKLPGY